MQIKRVNPESLGPPIAAFSNGVVAGNFIFVAGQAALGPDWEVLFPDDIIRQTEFVIDRIATVLNEAGATLEDVVATTVYVSDYAYYDEYNRVYGERFGEARPARATIRADLVRPGLLVEIQAIAVVRNRLSAQS